MEEILNIDELRKLSFEKIERLQNERFRAIASHLLSCTRFYRKLFNEHGVDPAKLKSVEDWHKAGLPLVKKLYYMNNVEDFIVKPESPFVTHAEYLMSLHSGEAVDFYIHLLHKQALQKKLYDYYSPKMPLFSGGTQSKRPTPTFITNKELHNLQEVMAVAAQMMGAGYLKDMETVGMNLFPYGPHLAWQAVQIAFNLGVNLNLATAAGGAMRTKDLVAMAEKFKANVFAGMADYIANRFLPMAVKAKITLGPKAVFINGSEEMSNKDREKIICLARKLGVIEPVVLDFYGASELKEDIMPECAPGAGFHHISPLSTIIRTVKINSIPKGDALITDWEFTKPEEGGAAVLWTIDGAGTLLQGYALGDSYGKIIKEKCPKCGLNTERIYGVKRIELK
ncbi:MAG: hypothetical protein QW666_00915 [Candidatus Woesearchaeota archaeon]